MVRFSKVIWDNAYKHYPYFCGTSSAAMILLYPDARSSSRLRTSPGDWFLANKTRIPGVDAADFQVFMQPQT